MTGAVAGSSCFLFSSDSVPKNSKVSLSVIVNAGRARNEFRVPPTRVLWPTARATGIIGFMSSFPVQPRITIEPGKCGGRPCIRGMRIRVCDVLELLANGASIEEILAHYPYLEREDILAAVAYAAQQTNHVVIEVA